MDVSFKGYLESIVTFKASGDISVGDPVEISADGTVTVSDTSLGSFSGFATSVRNGLVSVMLHGYKEIDYIEQSGEGAVPLAYGAQNMVVTTGKKLILAATGGKVCLVIKKDTTALTIGIIF